MRISDWSSDVCSSDLMTAVIAARTKYKELFEKKHGVRLGFMGFFAKAACLALKDVPNVNASIDGEEIVYHDYADISVAVSAPQGLVVHVVRDRSDEHTSELQSLMRISYAVFCLKNNYRQ